MTLGCCCKPDRGKRRKKPSDIEDIRRDLRVVIERTGRIETALQKIDELRKEMSFDHENFFRQSKILEAILQTVRRTTSSRGSSRTAEDRCDAQE